jgi:formimidoylglutamate deiminase
MRLYADRALLSDGVCDAVCVEVGDDGIIRDVRRDAARGDGVRVRGTLVQGMPNVHSHVFQRAIAARTQRVETGENSFWSWRTAMYRVARDIEPDELERLAEQTFKEMLAGGYTSVAEFHYLHAAPDGTAYANPAELSDRVIAAAQRAGITMTLLPVLYLHSDFGGAPLLAEQRRFSLGLDGYLELWRQLYREYAGVPRVRIGFAPHSLRAVTGEELRYALDAVRSLDATAPVHIHIAEQVREVEACRAVLKTTPVRALSEAVGIDERWCLVHATHADASELDLIAEAGAVVGLCPTTEADLGDGMFPASAFAARGGRFAIGSDSNVRIDAAEELRLLEYTQRLALQRRNVMTVDGIASVGEALYRSALAGGAQALGQDGGSIAPGARAALAVLDDAGPEAFDEYVFSGRARSHFVHHERIRGDV